MSDSYLQMNYLDYAWWSLTGDSRDMTNALTSISGLFNQNVACLPKLNNKQHQKVKQKPDKTSKYFKS